jgi:hypothetical protein
VSEKEREKKWGCEEKRSRTYTNRSSPSTSHDINLDHLLLFSATVFFFRQARRKDCKEFCFCALCSLGSFIFSRFISLPPFLSASCMQFLARSLKSDAAMSAYEVNIGRIPKIPACTREIFVADIWQ